MKIRILLAVILFLAAGATALPNQAEAAIPWPYPPVSISVNPSTITAPNSTVRVTWSSVWGDPWGSSYSPNAFSGQPYSCKLNGQPVAGVGSMDVVVSDDMSYTIACAGEVERGKCKDNISVRPDNGPDSVCRSMEKHNDDSKDSGGPRYYTHTATASVESHFPPTPLVPACSVTPSPASIGTEVAWSASATGGESEYQYGTWRSVSTICTSAQGLPVCDQGVTVGARCSTNGAACVQDEIFWCEDPGDYYKPNLAPRVSTLRCDTSKTYGVDGDYRYSWSGTDALAGTTALLKKIYTTPGIKTGTVAVSTQAGSATKMCQVEVGSTSTPTTNSLKICQGNCGSGALRGSTTNTGSFLLARGGTQNLVTCFNSSAGCSDSTGDVTSSTSWSEGGSNVISLSGTSPKVVTGDNSGTEGISASYSGQTANTNITVTCLPTVTCDNAPGASNYCQNDSFSVDNGCGATITCNGTKTCNYNWKEVAP